MLLETMMICALTMTAPYYDCDEPMWEINMYDDVSMNRIRNDWGDLVCPNPTGQSILGCATYSSSDNDWLITPVIHLSSILHYTDEWGMMTLEHEIKHLKCRCVWEGHK